MSQRPAGPADPFEGRGAQRRAARLRVEGLVAFGLAAAAVGMTAVAWIVALAPLAGLGVR